jgi:hypothetical protein
MLRELSSDNIRLAVDNSTSAPPKATVFGGGSGDGGGIVDTHTRDYVDGKMAAAKAENDTRFREVILKLDAMKFPSIWQIAGVAAVTLGSAFAILAYASDRFDGGLAAGVVLEESRKNS